MIPAHLCLYRAVNAFIAAVKSDILTRDCLGTDSLLEPRVDIRGTAAWFFGSARHFLCCESFSEKLDLNIWITRQLCITTNAHTEVCFDSNGFRLGLIGGR